MKHLGILLLSTLVLCQAATKTKQQHQHQHQQYSTYTARRERNLDHWDADTLAYYLGIDETTGKVLETHEYPGYDAAVLFYAQWCNNCHAFAPSWDAIATHVHAGSASSKLMMAVFDCERDARHMQLCSAAGVQHYPTLMFIGDGTYHDSDVVSRTLFGKKKSAGPAGPSPIPHTVKFQGQWQYADSVLDWIRLMQGFSRWHRWTSQGFLRHVRNGLLGFLRPNRLVKKKATSLPVGVPTTTTGRSSSSSMDEQVSLLQSQLKQSEEDGKLMERAAAHAGLLLDAILFPPKFQNATSDAFTVLNTTNAWDSTSQDLVHQVLRVCTVELSLDYCSRLSTHVTNKYLDEMANATDFPSFPVIETLLKDRIVQQEPYCGMFDDCLKENFSSSECKPTTCPFQDAGCRYVSACLDSTIEREYAVALGLIEEGDEFPPKQTTETTTDTASSAKKKKKSAWGL